MSKRYIDADKLVARINASPVFSNIGTDGFFIRDCVLDLIDTQPTADVVEVVRCRDCKYSRKIGKLRRCEHTNSATPIVPIEDGHYCSYGERKEK